MESKYRIKGLDGMRAMAVLMVWATHRLSVPNYGAGVYLFFVLSGFLIVDILRRQRESISRRSSNFMTELKSFVVRRTFRIFPVYYLFILFILPVAYLSGDQNITRTAVSMHLLYLVNAWVCFVTQSWNTMTTHLWSLSAEEQFYLLFPLIALSVDTKKLPVVCGAIVVIGLFTFLYYHLNALPMEDINPLVSFSKIALGGLFVLCASPRAPEDGNAFAWPAALIASYAVIPLASAFLGPTVASIYPFVPISVIAGLLLVSIKQNQQSFIVHLLELPPIRWLGLISYGFYVYHYPLQIHLMGQWHVLSFLQSIPKPAAHLLDFLMPLGAAVVSWKYLEAPILRRRSSPHSGPHELPVAVEAHERRMA